MTSTTFVDKVTRTSVTWFQDINNFFYTLFASATTAAQARTALSVYSTTQADTNFQPKDSELTAIAGLTSAADKLPYFTGSGTASLADLTASGRALIDDASTTVQLETLGIPTAIGLMGIPMNFSLTASVGSSALTMAVKTAASSDASSTDKIRVPFRSVTATSGAIVWRTISGALSTVISSGSTAGHNSALKQYIYWYLIDNAGTVELAWSSKFFGNHGIVSTTAEGGAGAADSGTTIYSTTARSSVPFTCVAYSEDTQTTAGTWATAPSQINLYPFSPPVISFAAHKNGTNQTGIVSTVNTKVTFGTEVYDNGNLFDSVTNYRWVPPPGTIKLFCNVYYSSIVDQTTYTARIFKNGASFANEKVTASGTVDLGVSVIISDECNGTDYYEIFTVHTAGSNRDLFGDTDLTYMYGDWSPRRS